LSPASLSAHLAGIDAIVNLAGENIASGRWTRRRKKQIKESRVKTGQLLCDAIRLSASKPGILVQASATGYYGTTVEIPVDEDQPAGTGFLAELTREWESSVSAAGKLVTRTVIIRTGLVLGKDEGLLKKMLIPFRLYSGTIPGSGRQWISWIHIRDEVGAICFLLENLDCSGPYNLTAPHPVTMKSFIVSLSEAINRPAWLKVPGILLKAAMGEMAAETVLSSQNILPGKLLQKGFIFEFPHLPEALKNLLTEKKSV
jgi:hypothetical protein